MKKKSKTSTAGKGDSPRKVNGDTWRQNYDKIFRKKQKEDN